GKPLTSTNPFVAMMAVLSTQTVLQYSVDALKKSKRFVGMLITAVMGITAITATAAIVGVALEQSIQAVDYITDWHKNSEMLWSSQ
ncbi:hypothetical protein EI555_001099, partial [Monodon monoceros]